MQGSSWASLSQSLLAGQAMGGKSKGKKCKKLNNQLCNLALDGSGGPIVLSRSCKTCGEWRCRSHCGCGRSATHAPRRNPRSAKKRPAATVQSECGVGSRDPVLPVAAAAASRRALAVDVLPGSTWFDAMLADTRRAASWVGASYMFDDPETKNVLLDRLRSPTPFECTLVVDARAHRENPPREQRRFLRALQAAGATIVLGTGSQQAARRLFGPRSFGGQMHTKAIVIDSRVAYAGGANCTRQSRCNRELMFRMVGPPVTDILSEISAAVANATGDAL